MDEKKLHIEYDSFPYTCVVVIGCHRVHSWVAPSVDIALAYFKKFIYC